MIRRDTCEEYILLAFLAGVSLWFLIEAWGFDQASSLDGPAVVPLFLSATLLLSVTYRTICLLGFDKTLSKTLSEKDSLSHPRLVIFLVLMLCAYLLAIPALGYFVSSLLFIPLLAFCLSTRSFLTLTLLSALWSIFAFLVFFKLLKISLPSGVLF